MNPNPADVRRAAWRTTVVAVSSAWLALASADARAADAYVLAVRGSWTLAGQEQALVVGTGLPAASRVRARQAEVGDRIVIVAARSGAVLLSHECLEARNCGEPLVVPASAAAAPTAWEEVLRRVMARLEGAPDLYVATLSRHDAALPDGVLVLGAAGVDLAPALAALPAGRYELALRRLDCADGPACAEQRRYLNWPMAAGQAVSLPARAGVHELRVRVLDAKVPLKARRARVLLVPAADAATTPERYRDWVTLVASWGDSVDPGTRSSLLHAVMDELAAAP